MENEEKVLTEENKNISEISLRFGEEERTFTAEEIVGFIEKSEKFDLIDGEYNRLKNMAGKSGLSVEEFLNSLQSRDRESRRCELLEKCSGNETLADYVLELEEKNDAKADASFEEIKMYFPNMESINEIPKEVFKSASVKGSNLLNEYLRHLQMARLTLRALEKNKKEAIKSNIGSQREMVGADYDHAKLQFIKGIWNK